MNMGEEYLKGTFVSARDVSVGVGWGAWRCRGGILGSQDQSVNEVDSAHDTSNS